MKVNRNLVVDKNNFFPTTANKMFLIRILYEYLQRANKKHRLVISFNTIRKNFDIDIRQKYINKLLDEIVAMTFTFNGKEYRYIESYTNNFDERSYTIIFSTAAVRIWHENTISYDFNIIKDIKSNKYAITLYEYFKTNETFMCVDKFYDIFTKESYGFYEKRRELEKAVAIINKNTDIKASVEYSHKKNGFIISYS